MAFRSGDAGERHFSARGLAAMLNGDILREIRTADSCLRHATRLSREHYPVVASQIALCAAAAMANATALAAEVFALGAVPVVAGCRKVIAPSTSTSLLPSPAQLRVVMAHYRRRLHMAEKLGLLRLRDVFRQIVDSKERHLSQSGLIQEIGTVSRYSCS